MTDTTLESHRRLVETIRRAPDREWVEDFLDLVEELLDATDMTSDDPRLALTIPQGRVLPVNINQRYVLAAFNYSSDAVGFIVGAEYVANSDVLELAANLYRFRSSRKNDRDPPPVFVEFKGPIRPDDIDGLRYAWIEAARGEMNRGRCSGFRKRHNEIFYDAVADYTYRRQLLTEAFGERLGT